MISTRFSRDCSMPQFGPDEFAVRIINDSDFRIDSADVSLYPENRYVYDGTFRDTYATSSHRRSQCYHVFPKTYEVGAETRNYTRFRISAADFLANSAGLSHFDVQEASGKYTYSIDIERYMTVGLELLARFQTEAEEGDKTRVRVVNETGSDLKDVEYILECLSIPFLAAGDSTDYFEIAPTRRIPVISLVIGADTVYQESTYDTPGFNNIPPGRYVSRIDTFQTKLLRELGAFARDE